VLFRSGDYVSIKKYLGEINWTTELNQLNTQQSWDLFNKTVDFAIDKFIPLCDKPRTGKQWCNANVKARSKEKRNSWSKLWKIIKSNRSHIAQIDTSTSVAEWNTSRNISTKCSDDARIAHEKKIIAHCKDNPKTFWSYVKSKTKKPGDVSSLLNPEGQLSHNDNEKAKLLNSYFSSVFVHEDGDNFFENNKTNDMINTLSSIEVNQNIILESINKLKVSKAPGPDGIHARIIIECKDIFSFIFNIMFNKSLQEGSLPSQWKQANVKALFKKGKRTECSNYRPVSLTSIICKLFEGLIRDRLMIFLESLNLITCHQHGFRAGHSCTTQLLLLMEDFTNYYEQDIPFDCIYLDFAKAFDRVPHQRLLTKVHNIGIRGKLLNWIRNFLTNRQQRVMVNDSYSNWSNVVSGIPQGSVLGPMLFTIFINDIPVDIASSIKIFADDTKIYNTTHHCDIIQSDLDKLAYWSEKWLLPFNVDKCKVLHYGKKNTKQDYEMHGNIIASSLSIKDLGITFQVNLSFDEHICKITSMANSRLGIIKNLFQVICKEEFLILYKAYARPLLEFGTTVWSPFLRKHEIAIEKVQKRATSLVRGYGNMSYPERLKDLRLPTLFYRRRRSDMIQVFRIINEIDNIDFDVFFELNTSITRKNHVYKLNKPRGLTSQKRHCFSHRVVNDWNDLPRSVGELDSVNSFKSVIEDFWNKVDFKYDFKF